MQFLFPGQGSQIKGMNDGFSQSSIYQRTLEQASDTLNYSFFELFHSDQLNLTEFTQPAILAHSIGILRHFENLKPMTVSGHSLGEYSALVASGALKFEDALKAVSIRGKAMQEAVPVGIGAMSAILGMEKTELESLCTEVSKKDSLVSIANDNSPGQLVVSGHLTAVENLETSLKSMRKKAIRLTVSAPFHCPLMEPAKKPLMEFLNSIEIYNLNIPIIPNVKASLESDSNQILSHLEEQVTGQVRWTESMNFALKRGQKFIEIGPSTVLSNLLKKIAKGTEYEEKIEVFQFQDYESIQRYFEI